MTIPTVIRAITFPVAEPVSEDWATLRKDLAGMWALTTQASNWLMRELYVRDIRRNGEAKMPKYQHWYTYPELRKRFPDLPPQTLTSLGRAVTRKYTAKRYEIIWTCASSLPTFRYPTPFPIHNQSWSCWFDEGNRPIVNPRIADSRFELRLRGGPRYRRQLTAFRQLVSGEVKAGEMAIYKNHDGEILCKMVGRFPLTERHGLSGTLTLKTAEDVLLYAHSETGERLVVWNWPHVSNWVQEHRVRLAMFAEDQKAEQRPEASFTAKREAASLKFNHRIDSAVKECAAQAIGLATRWKKARVVYDDSIRHSRLRELRNDGRTFKELLAIRRAHYRCDSED